MQQGEGLNCFLNNLVTLERKGRGGREGGRSMMSSKRKQWYESKTRYCIETGSGLAFSIKKKKTLYAVYIQALAVIWRPSAATG